MFDVAQREQKRIYGATRESAVLPRGWLNSKVPDRVTQHGGEVLVSLCVLRSLPRPRTHIKKERPRKWAYEYDSSLDSSTHPQWRPWDGK